jgi:aminomethyltransferase
MKRTSLHDLHVRDGARMVDFAGWSMPVEYEGIVAEHTAVRHAAGLFDVGHMGEFRVTGSEAGELLQYVTTNDVGILEVGRAQYSAMAYPNGGVVDDCLLYRVGPENYMLVVNAANIGKDLEWIQSHNTFDAELTDISDETGMIAIQGPMAASILKNLSPTPLKTLASYHFVETSLGSVDGLLSRTGYTGEDGFEFYCPELDVVSVWDRILEAGRPLGLRPVGLGARNTLRLEAGLLLYGNDLDHTTTLLEAGLGWIVKPNTSDFIGREKLLQQKAEGIDRKLVGFQMQGREVARDRYPVEVEGQTVGLVTSGSPSITLKKNIGLAYVPVRHSAVGTCFDVAIRKRLAPAEVVPTPFYRRRELI